MVVVVAVVVCKKCTYPHTFLHSSCSCDVLSPTMLARNAALSSTGSRTPSVWQEAPTRPEGAPSTNVWELAVPPETLCGC